MGIIAQIVGRCHVGDSYLTVCREVYKSLKPKARKSKALRVARKQAYAEAIKVHNANRKLYHYIMK